MKVRQTDQQNRVRISRSGTARFLRTILKGSGCPDAELSVAWVDDAIIRALNRKWLDRDRATDVLSFPMSEERFAEPAGELLGDVVISLQSALRLARRRKIPINRVVAHLLVHGVLHLLGHEHVGNARRRAVMRREERRLLKRASSFIPALGVVPLPAAQQSAVGRSRGRGRRNPKKRATARPSR